MRSFLFKGYGWVIFLVLLSLGSLTAELVNRRFQMPDLAVYQKAAVRLMNGEELYRSAEEDPYEHYVFKYSPPAALLFIPMAAAGFEISRVLYWILLTFLLGSVLFNVKHIFAAVQGMNRQINLSLILTMLCVGTHFFRELHLGQVNLLLSGMYLFALRLMLDQKHIPAGLLLAASLFIKPFALIFIPLLLITGRFKEVIWVVVFLVILFFTPLLFYHDLQTFLGLYKSWVNELLLELGSKQELMAEGNLTIFSVIYRYTPLSHLIPQGLPVIIYQLILLSLTGLLILWHLFIRKSGDGFPRMFLILTAMIPLLAYTSYNAFIFVLPLLAFLMLKFREMNHVSKGLFIAGCLMTGGNIYDLVGKELFDHLYNISVYTWGAIALLTVVFINWKKFSVSAPEGKGPSGD
jgi:hypothetical protein